LFSKTDIMLEFKTAAQTPLIINGNAEKLKQVFINLILNALEAMQQHGTLTIQTSCDQGQALVSVRDTGEGILPEDLPNIFEPFYTKKVSGWAASLFWQRYRPAVKNLPLLSSTLLQRWPGWALK